MPSFKWLTENWKRKCIDVFLYLTVVVGLCISYSGYIVPKNTYIRCDDVSILHEPKKDTISVFLLLVVSLFVPFVMMSVFECIAQRFKVGLKNAYNHFLALLVGSLFAFFLVEVLKTATSEARPHFMKSCSPKSCSPNITINHSHQTWIHVTLNDCLNPYNLEPRLLLDVMKSFPSGHACIGIFSAVFMTIYMQIRVKDSWSLLFIAWVQTMWWTWALLCCCSRIWDRRHHWWDVLAGAVIGGIAAYATVAYLCKWFISNSNDGRTTLEAAENASRQLLPITNGHFRGQTIQSDK